YGWRAIERTACRSRRGRPIPGKPTQASASEKCLRQSRYTFSAAHARRLRSLLLLHFQFYRGPPPLARAAVRDHNRSIGEEVCAGLVQPRDKTMPPSPSALRRKNDAEYHTFVRAYLPRSADMCATVWRN